MRVIQLVCRDCRRAGVVEEPHIRLFLGNQSIYDLAQLCFREGAPLEHVIEHALSEERVHYDEVYEGKSEWSIALPVEHPIDSAHCMVSGTGLTHKASAKNRDAMHAGEQAKTDSTRMYELGLEGGRPEPGVIGVSPEWFYKGDGSILRAHNHSLTVPEYAENGGEEPEVAGIYIIGPDRKPRRIGFAAGNEFSDHVFEKRNYLYLASSKLRECSIGPELVVGGDFHRVSGEVLIERNGETLWKRDIATGEEVMSHSLANIEHHHFKFEAHRHVGDLHIHYFGADAFSFGDNILLQDEDVMQVRFDGFGRPLRNRVRQVPASADVVTAKPL